MNELKIGMEVKNEMLIAIAHDLQSDSGYTAESCGAAIEYVVTGYGLTDEIAVYLMDMTPYLKGLFNHRYTFEIETASRAEYMKVVNHHKAREKQVEKIRAYMENYLQGKDE